MDLETVRTLALALPEAIEAPHFDFQSYRVRGKIFATVPPDRMYVHLFVAEVEREQALALYPGFLEALLWGGKVVGIRVRLAGADRRVVAGLVRQAWRNKAPRRLLAEASDA